MTLSQRSIAGVEMSAARFAVIAAAAVLLAACAGTPGGPGPSENTGTLVGAGSGALLGAAVAGGGAGNRLAGAAIGGLLGGLIGNRIGAALDESRARPTRRPAIPAAPIPTPSISMGGHKPPAAPPAAIRTAPGRRSASEFPPKTRHFRWQSRPLISLNCRHDWA
jgi:hypothetical protein